MASPVRNIPSNTFSTVMPHSVQRALVSRPIGIRIPVTAEDLNSAIRAVGAAAGLDVDIANIDLMEAGSAGDPLCV